MILRAPLRQTVAILRPTPTEEEVAANKAEREAQQRAWREESISSWLDNAGGRYVGALAKFSEAVAAGWAPQRLLGRLHRPGQGAGRAQDRQGGIPHRVHFPARLGDVRTGGEYGLTIARSKADFPSVTIEYSSSRVWRWGGTSAPTGNGCSTTETWPLVSRSQNLKATPIMPKSPVAPSPGCKMVRGGGST